jgi:hypothetical protein
MNLFFKIRGIEQGHLFSLNSIFIPSIAFGINKNSTFAVIGYEIWIFDISMGYDFSDNESGIFANISFQPIKYITIQTEYIDKFMGFGIRIQYFGIELSIIRHKIVGIFERTRSVHAALQD